MGIVDNMIVFDGRTSKDFNVLLSGFDTYTAPERDVERVSVPGRNGDVVIDNGRYENVDVTYKCLLLRHLETDYSEFIAWLMSGAGYKRLEDTFHPDEFRMASFKGSVKPKLYDYENASFSITFNCKPQRWLKSGEDVTTLIDGGTIINETSYTAKPLIRAYSAGTLTVNGQSLTISSVDGYVDIDSERLNAYKGSTNKNSTVSGVFPTFVAGENVITYTGRLEITPRWWRL